MLSFNIIYKGIIILIVPTSLWGSWAPRFKFTLPISSTSFWCLDRWLWIKLGNWAPHDSRSNKMASATKRNFTFWPLCRSNTRNIVLAFLYSPYFVLFDPSLIFSQRKVFSWRLGIEPRIVLVTLSHLLGPLVCSAIPKTNEAWFFSFCRLLSLLLLTDQLWRNLRWRHLRH